MDFSTEGWMVDKAADDLSSGLFDTAELATSKKQQKREKKTTNLSDDGKRKFSKSVGSRQTLNCKDIDNYEVLKGGITLKKSRDKERPQRVGQKTGGQRKTSMTFVTEERGENAEQRFTQIVKGNKRKTDHTEIPSKKQKRISPIDPVTDIKEEGRKKKKKKKNSNKRNKYKHLSVKKTEVSADSNVCDDNITEEQSSGDVPAGATVKQSVTNSSDHRSMGKMVKERQTSVPKSLVPLNNVTENCDELKLIKHKKKKGKRVDGIQAKSGKEMKDDKYPINTVVNSKLKKEQSDNDFDVETSDLLASGSIEQKDKSREITLSLKQRMLDKLKSARFRYLNEQLYNQTGSESYKMFEEDKEAFHVYHQGFQSQVAKWPTNPVNVIIRQLQARPRTLVVADFGCGDALIARSLPNKVHSFDLVAINKYVTACDMAKVPLKKDSVDVAVFCLSLMGKNLPDYLTETSRVLKPGGTLKVAEVTSRIRNLANFKRTMDKFGFRLLNEDTTNKMFCLFDFKKSKPPKHAPEEFHLEPCLYKRR
ncbi:uncharacterized protein LOC132545142 [Ylistrum balloti]|uniref:uncharacterized protein LOC132545142 n=1 Tax=Ylistrum balloti TaxID=509963 RepID=UPI002905A233|nr:uncharacterized protein LOC132545142 [Ylistrum balloti]